MAALWHALTAPALAQQAADPGAHGSIIRAGCAVVADSQGRAVSQHKGAEGGSGLPSYCPKAAPPAQPEPAPVAAPEPPAATLKAEPATPSPPLALAQPAPRPPAAVIHASRKTAPATPATQPPAAEPQPIAMPVLASTRTTQAFGEPPSLRLDPAGASLALVAGGGLLWFLRSGFALSFLLLGLPVWRDIDLLPVVDGHGNVPEDSDDEPERAARRLLSSATQESRPA